jgi:hypothetical protein
MGSRADLDLVEKNKSLASARNVFQIQQFFKPIA